MNYQIKFRDQTRNKLLTVMIMKISQNPTCEFQHSNPDSCESVTGESEMWLIGRLSALSFIMWTHESHRESQWDFIMRTHESQWEFHYADSWVSLTVSVGFHYADSWFSPRITVGLHYADSYESHWDSHGSFFVSFQTRSVRPAWIRSERDPWYPETQMVRRVQLGSLTQENLETTACATGSTL